MMTMTASDLTLCLSGCPKPATQPPELVTGSRDSVRMLVSVRADQTFQHATFCDLPHFLSPGDLLVVNHSATCAAALPATVDETPLRLHLAVQIGRFQYVVERRNAQGLPDETPFATDATLSIGVDPYASARVLRKFHERSRFWVIECNQDLWEVARRAGQPVRYSYVPEQRPIEEYQSLFSRIPGSAEMPSAARPFTHQIVRALVTRGVRIAGITLHTGLSSHEVTGMLEDHPLLPEWYSIPKRTVREIEAAQAAGRRIIAVGTTVVRALESAACHHGRVMAEQAWTTHLVTPQTPPTVVTGLLTGLHENQSSHLALLFSFVSKSHIERAYQSAIERGYLWHEFGDVHLMI